MKKVEEPKENITTRDIGNTTQINIKPATPVTPPQLPPSENQDKPNLTVGKLTRGLRK